MESKSLAEIENQKVLSALEALMTGLKEAGTDGWYYDEYQLIKDFIKDKKTQTTAYNV